MGKYSICYVILHYLAFDETIACVDSVLKIIENDDSIIIIDNASSNGTGEKLKEYYKDIKKIEIVLNKENVGFAKANNIGFMKAKKDYKSDFIVCLNNDTEIRQSDFRGRIISSYEKYNYAVAGPKIIQADGSVCTASPSIPIHTTIKRARIGQISFVLRYVLSAIASLDVIFSKLFDKEEMDGNFLYDDYHEDVQILGCCIIFSPLYINQFDGFNPDTFLYFEELLLYLRVKKARLKISYIPSMEIIHIGQVSTKMSVSKTGRYRRMRYRNQLKSFKIVIKELKGM